MEARQKITYYDCASGRVTFEERTPAVVDESTLARQVESNVVGVYPDYLYQTMEGFGCAMTESACWLLSKMEPQTRRDALECWFGEKGMDARFIRIPIDSCDYALSEYQAVEDPIADPELATFSIKRDRQYILPVVKEAMALAGHELSVLLSPWSPPAAWKTPPEISQNDAAVYGGQGADVDFSKPGRCFGGRLKPEFYGSWARYLVKYIRAYLEEGINVTMLSVQNEASAATSWDSCLWSGEEESRFLRDFLYPEMKAAGLTDRVGIYIWDHNKERMVEHIGQMMENGIGDMVEGFAYHWYSGDHFRALSMLRERYPDKVLMHSESCGLHMPGKALSFDVTDAALERLPETIRKAAEVSPLEMDYRDAAAYAHDIIGDLNNGMNRFIDWNLCVDRNGGPRHVRGGFAAPIVAEDDGSFTRTVSYEYLLQIAKAVPAGSRRLGVSVWADQAEAAAVQRPDGTVGLLLLNRKEEEQKAAVRLSGFLCEVTLPARTLSVVEFAE